MDERKFKQSEPLSPHIHLIPLSPEHAEGQEPGHASGISEAAVVGTSFYHLLLIS